MNFSRSNSSTCDSALPGIEGISLSGETCNRSEAGAWWKNQIRGQIVHAKAEGVEREQRRQYAITLSEIEQARRVQEDKINSLEEAEERKRRREYAKAVIREEQWTRIREQTEAAARDEAERHRRRRMALKALKSEEARQIEVRLQAKARLKTGNFELVAQEEQLRQSLRRRNRALFVAGIRLHIQYFRAMEHERFSVAGDKINIKRSKVEQAVRDIYLRDCFDDQEGPDNSFRSASQQAVLPVRTSSFVWNADEKPDLRLELSREVLGATPAFSSQTNSAADFFRPLPIPILADLHDSDRMSA